MGVRSAAVYAVLLAVLAALVMVVTVAADPKPAEAAFPGRSGKIAFVSGRDGNFEVHGMSAAGASQQNLTSSAARDEHPAWSPNGKKIAFDSNRDGNSEVYRISTAGGAPTRLTFDPAFDSSPAWQPLP